MKVNHEEGNRDVVDVRVPLRTRTRNKNEQDDNLADASNATCAELCDCHGAGIANEA